MHRSRRLALLLGAVAAWPVLLTACVTDSTPHPDSISLTPGSFCAQYVPVTYAPTDSLDTKVQTDRNNRWFSAHCTNNGNVTLTP